MVDFFLKNKNKTNHNTDKKDVSIHSSNYLRSKYVLAFVAILEVLMLILCFAQFDNYHLQYRNIYAFMYFFLFTVTSSGFFILLINKNLEDKPKSVNTFVVIFAEIFLLWGAALSILDNILYAHLVVFATNLMFCSTAFIIRPKTFIKIILLPVAVIFIALPYTQPSTMLLFGNYINASILIFASIMNNYLQYSLFKKQEIQKNEMKRLSEYDGLTNMHNRRTLNNFIDTYNEKEEKESLGILMIDIDHFKKYNDHYGHIAGDTVIREIGYIVNNFTDEHDGFAARYGGEEFILIFENLSHDLVYSIAESICKEIRNKDIKHSASLCGDRISVSIGLYYTPSSSNNLWDAIKHADDALFKAKNEGRNKISEVE
ncbi:MAG: GGDEF domain-containing protein [Cloacibacillus sp.]